MKEKPKKSKVEQVEKTEPDEKVQTKTETNIAELKDAPIFEITMSDIKNFRQIVSIAMSVLDIVGFVLKQDGIHIRGMDVSHVTEIDMHLPVDCFTAYTVSKEGTMAFDPHTLLEILDTMSTGKEFTISGVDMTANQINVSIGSKESVSIHVMSDGVPETPLPKVNWQADITMERKNLVETLSGLRKVSDMVEITVLKNGLLTFHSADDGGKRDRSFDVEIDVNYCDGTEKAVVMVSTDMLLGTLKRCTSQYATLRLSDMMPLCVSMSAFDNKSAWLGTTPMGRVDFYLAPRVQS